MGDYMFMLESHLSPAQNAALRLVQQTAVDAGYNIYLTGGAMRDMLGGFPIRNLDFTMEGKTLRLVKKLTDIAEARIVGLDDNRNVAHLRFPGQVSVRLSMARKETYPKAGGSPKVTAATIHEDLMGRDFTINAIALSLNPASLGLLIDPANGMADLERRELSTTYNYSLYDDPIRMLRLLRYETRLGFSISEKTARQLENAKLAGVQKMIPAHKLRSELRHIANDEHCSEIVSKLEESGFMHLFGFEEAMSRTTLTSLGKFDKLREMIPPDHIWDCNYLPVFLNTVAEGFSSKKRSAFAKNLELEDDDVQAWQKLPAVAGRLEKKLMALSGTKIDEIYLMLHHAPPEEVTYLFVHSRQRLVQDRIKNFLQKYLWIAQEVPDQEVIEEGAEPGTAKFEKIKAKIIAKRVRAKPKKTAEELEAEAADEEELARSASA
jgi:tRNA nucleotidyltransferase (CCA-adding enzyme)